MTTHQLRTGVAWVPLLLWCMVQAACFAEDPVTAAPPSDPLSSAVCVLQVNDLSWLQRQATAFASAAGVSPDPMVKILAGILFDCRSLAGIDGSRTALIAWRKGKSPYMAIIPLSDREAFLSGFGDIPDIAPPLVMIGEEGGTSIYSQNSAKGLWEYRLMIANQTAYIARTSAECQALANHSLPVRPDQPPVVFHASGAVLSLPGIHDGISGLDGVAASAALGILGRAVTDIDQLTSQVVGIDCRLTGGGDGSLHIHATLDAQGDSSLAQWIGNQKNQASRLLPVVHTPDTLAFFYGRIAWQGQLENIGLTMIQSLQHQLGPDRWTAAVEEAWRTQWQILDHQGAFAMSVSLPDRAVPTPGFQFRSVIEQPRAGELAALDPVVDAAVGKADQVAQDISITGVPGRRWKLLGSGLGLALDEVQVGTAEYLVRAISSTGDAPTLATALLEKLRSDSAPEGTPGIAVLGLDLNRAIHLIGRAQGTPPPVRPGAPLSMECAISTNAQSELVADLTMPIKRLAIALRDSGVLNPPQPATSDPAGMDQGIDPDPGAAPP